MQTRFYPIAKPGTSAVDHLAGDVAAYLPDAGYSTRAAAERGWYRACRRVYARRRELGYSTHLLPGCAIVKRA